jgi:hypothetical protein
MRPSCPKHGTQRGLSKPLTPLILKRASASRPSGQWRDDDYDVLEDGVVVGRIFIRMSNCDLVAAKSLIHLAASRLALRRPSHLPVAAPREPASARSDDPSGVHP